jgi:hypothetical protein
MAGSLVAISAFGPCQFLESNHDEMVENAVEIERRIDGECRERDAERAPEGSLDSLGCLHCKREIFATSVREGSYRG